MPTDEIPAGSDPPGSGGARPGVRRFGRIDVRRAARAERRARVRGSDGAAFSVGLLSLPWRLFASFSDPRRWPLLAVVVYGACAVGVFGTSGVVGFGSGVVGSSPASDYQVFAWSLEWWPWALQHGADPLHTDLVWAPYGYATAWMTSVPALALVAAPVTLLAGPLVAYNLLMLAALPLAALAMFLLARDLTGRFLPSLAAGYLYGFSAYMLGQAAAQHLNLVQVWPLPLIVLVSRRRIRGETSARRCVIELTGLWAFLLGSSLELFATAATLGLATAAGLCLSSTWRRSARARIVGVYGVVVAAMAVLAAPFAWSTLAVHRPPLLAPAGRYAIDLANLAVPTTTESMGTSSGAIAISERFAGNLGEQGGYLGLPLIAILAIAVVSLRAQLQVRIAAFVLMLALAASLGPQIALGGRVVVSNPLAIGDLPVLGLALPSRLAVYTALAAAILAAIWLARPRARLARVALGIAALAALAPHAGRLTTPADDATSAAAGVPSFGWDTPTAPASLLPVTPGDPTLLVLPGGSRTTAAFWQASSGMRFRLADGYTPFLPPNVVGDPLVQALGGDVPPPLAVPRLRSFVLRGRIDTIVVTPATAPAWIDVVARATGSPPLSVSVGRAYRVDRARIARSLSPPRPRREPGFAFVDPAYRTADAAQAVRSGGRRVVAWLAFDAVGRTARVLVANGTEPVVAVSAIGAEAASLRLAAMSDGGVAVAWTEARAGTVTLHGLRYIEGRRELLRVPATGPVLSVSLGAAGSDADLAWVEQDATGSGVARVARFDRDGGLVDVATLSTAAGAAISLAGDGDTLFAVWGSRRGADEVLLIASRRGAQPWSAPRDVAVSGDAIESAAVAAAGGQALVAWIARSEDRTARLFAVVAGNHSTGPTRLLESARPAAPVRSFAPGVVTSAPPAPDLASLVVTATPAGSLLMGWQRVLGRFRATRVAIVDDHDARRLGLSALGLAGGGLAVAPAGRIVVSGAVVSGAVFAPGRAVTIVSVTPAGPRLASYVAERGLRVIYTTTTALSAVFLHREAGGGDQLLVGRLARLGSFRHSGRAQTVRCSRACRPSAYRQPW